MSLFLRFSKSMKITNDHPRARKCTPRFPAQSGRRHDYDLTRCTPPPLLSVFSPYSGAANLWFVPTRVYLISNTAWMSLA